MSKIVHVFVRVFNTTTTTVYMKLGLNEKCFCTHIVGQKMKKDHLGNKTE